MDAQPMKTLQDLGRLELDTRCVVQKANRRETVVELYRLADARSEMAWVVRVSLVTTRPMLEKEARRRFLEEAAFLLQKSQS